MDDGIYLLLAKNIGHSRWFPQDVPTHFEGLYVPDLASTEHPIPITSYYIAMIERLDGGLNEVNLHAGFLVFPLILACSMYLLARRYTAHPLLASLSLMFLPAVYVLSHTLMTDIPQLAFAVLAVALFTEYVEGGNRICGWLGAASATIASLISYSSLCLIPLLAALAILKGHRRALKRILILPIVCFGGWLAVSLIHYGRLPPMQLLHFYFLVVHAASPVLLMKKSIYIILTAGSVMIFPLALLVTSRKIINAIALLLAGPAIWISGAWQYSLFGKVLFIVLFCAGTAGIFSAIEEMISGDEDNLFLGSWFVGMLIFTAGAYMTGSARYLFGAMPPFVLLFYRRLERQWRVRDVHWIAASSLVLALTLGILISAVDYEFAGVYREFESKFRESNKTGQPRVWFAGEWGFRAYLERSGGEELGRRDDRPRKGDVLAVPAVATPYATLFDERSIILRSTYTYRTRFPVRLLDQASHAGFWSMGWGMLPVSFAWNDSRLETIRAYEITRGADNNGETTPLWYIE